MELSSPAVPSEMLKSFIDSDELQESRKSPSNGLKSVSNPKAVTTLCHQPMRPTTLSSASSSRGSMILPIFEDGEDGRKPSPSSRRTLKNKLKKAIIFRKSHSQAKMVPDNNFNTNLYRAYSMDSPLNTLHAYNPNVPLTNFPSKKSFCSHGLVSVKSVKTSIGPLTKNVCEKLNMSLDLDNWKTKVLS